MAKPHKKVGRSIQVASTLPAAELADLCKQAAQQSSELVRLEEAKPGMLVFTVRSRLLRGQTQFMTFEVRLASQDGKRTMTSRILRYKIRQQKLLYLVPLEPAHMLGLTSYEQFMERFGELARGADPEASVAVTG
jgi:hypothetical protein